ncbi:unnamed protein product [Blepharisma stoltei]|uniref:Uncharacterized protein n=1 Tax=Blepharisma stoltei TaxID=1481888 RepID=A0AAU9JMT6_9CILI|nr:unnamed protein product [Blepharisma stoltei]
MELGKSIPGSNSKALKSAIRPTYNNDKENQPSSSHSRSKKSVSINISSETNIHHKSHSLSSIIQTPIIYAPGMLPHTHINLNANTKQKVVQSGSSLISKKLVMVPPPNLISWKNQSISTVLEEKTNIDKHLKSFCDRSFLSKERLNLNKALFQVRNSSRLSTNK